MKRFFFLIDVAAGKPHDREKRQSFDNWAHPGRGGGGGLPLPVPGGGGGLPLSVPGGGDSLLPGQAGSSGDGTSGTNPNTKYNNSPTVTNISPTLVNTGNTSPIVYNANGRPTRGDCICN